MQYCAAGAVPRDYKVATVARSWFGSPRSEGALPLTVCMRCMWISCTTKCKLLSMLLSYGVVRGLAAASMPVGLSCPRFGAIQGNAVSAVRRYTLYPFLSVMLTSLTCCSLAMCCGGHSTWSGH